MKNFPHNFAVGNDDLRAVRMEQRRRKQFNRRDLPVNSKHIDVIADAEWLGEDNGQPGDKVA